MIDYVVQAIRSRFDQNGYQILSKLEQMLCNSEAYLDNFEDVLSLYGNDFNKDCLQTQLKILHNNLPNEIKSEKGGVKLKSIVKFLQSMSPAECQFYSYVFHLAKLILVMPATNAVSERSLSALRRLKTWLRNTIHQTRLNWCMILHIHKDEADKLDLKEVANEFVSRNSSRQRHFV